MIIMDLSEGQLKILYIIAEKSHLTLSESIFDTAVINASGLSADEANT